MRSEKIRKADKAAFCRSASRRYRIIVNCGQRNWLGHGCITGHQMSIPVLMVANAPVAISSRQHPGLEGRRTAGAP